MSAWAYACHPCDGPGAWWVACPQVDEMPPSVHVLRVRVDGDWRCARVDRGQRVAVDGSLLRDAVASDGLDCPACAEAVAGAPVAASAASSALPPAAATPPRAGAGSQGRQVQAAAISLAGHRFVVVLVPLALVRSPGEATMAADDLAPHFGGAPMVLMGQTDDGEPEYHGDAALRALLVGVPPDRMPWRAYTLG